MPEKMRGGYQRIGPGKPGAVDERAVELGVAEEQCGRWFGHVVDEVDECAHNDRQDELQAVLPRVVLQVLDVGAYLLLAKERSEPEQHSIR